MTARSNDLLSMALGVAAGMALLAHAAGAPKANDEDAKARARAETEAARRALADRIKPMLRQPDPKLAEQAAEEAQHPVRPGEPGKQEFWSIRHLARFIYPPSVGFEEAPGATRYRYDVYPKNAKAPSASFEADKPWRPLTPIWKQLPASASPEIRYTLKVVALDASGKELGPCKYKVAVGGGADGHPAKGSTERRLPNGMREVVWGHRDVLAFQKMPSFAGPYLDPIRDYDQAVLEKFRQMRDSPDIGYTFTMVPLKSDETMPKFGVPGNGEISTATQVAMSSLALLHQLSPDAAEKKQALEMARRAGDWLIGQSRTPLKLPSTYHGMICHCHRAGLGYLDLYRVTKEPKWLKAAEDLAQTLAGLQQPSGTWTWTRPDRAGKPDFSPCIQFFGISDPEFDASDILYFYGRLRKEAGCTRFAEVETKALHWVMENSAKTFYWRDHQGNDGPHRPLGNVSLSVVNYFVRYLLEWAEPTEANLKLADEVLRFCEDQYMDWSRNPDGLDTPRVGGAWPPGANTSLFAVIYLKLYEKTKRPLDQIGRAHV